MPQLATAPAGRPAIPGRPDVAGYVDSGSSSFAEDDEPVHVDDVYTSKLSPEARRRLKAKHIMYEEIKNQVTTQPENTADLIKSWIVSDAKLSH
jgi:flagellar biosynthesis/type III secretory pathway M-ring protein FliF/YscJ